MDPWARPLSAGDVLAFRYSIIRALGEGGMALAFEGEHVRLGQRVALKVIRPELAGHAELVARFEREGRAASRLRSRHAARIFDVDVTDTGVPFLAMDLLEGNELAAELELRGVLPVSEAVAYVVEACAALAEAHALGIVHRDVKPSNLFLTTEGSERIVKVLDFGIATSPLDDDGRLTRTGAVMGTPLYLAPEQFRSSKDVDARADVWSLGATLYELLSGRPPFEGSAASVGIAIVSDPLPSLRALRPDVPEGLAAAIARTLEKDRAARFQTVTELRDAIAPFASAASVAAFSEPNTPPAVASPDAPTLAQADRFSPPARAERSAVESARTDIAVSTTTPAPVPAGPGRRRVALPAAAAAIALAVAWPRRAPEATPAVVAAETASPARASAFPAPAVAPAPTAAPHDDVDQAAALLPRELTMPPSLPCAAASVLFFGLAIAAAAPAADAPPAALPAPEVPAPAVRAASLREQGNQSMIDMRYVDALAAYEGSLSLAPGDVTLLYSIARARELLGEFPEALAALERFAAEAPASVKTRVGKLDELVTQLRARVSTLTIKCNVAGARVLVRHSVVGATPLAAPVRLIAGAVTATAEKRYPCPSTAITSASFAGRHQTHRLLDGRWAMGDGRWAMGDGQHLRADPGRRPQRDDRAHALLHEQLQGMVREASAWLEAR